MGKLKTIARRSFLIGSVAVAGGAAFGVYTYKKPYANPLLDDLAEGDATLNPFVLINKDGVTIITPRAEMGQGIQSTLAAMVAEELDVAWESVKFEHGPAASAYYNNAMFAAGVPFNEFDKSFLAETLRSGMKKLGKILAIQLTGGSTATIDGIDKMRMAGCSAREALKTAAAERWDVEAASLKTENGAVINPANGEKLDYREIASEAADARPATVPLRDPSQWKYLGKSMPRLDMPAKATGTAEFGIDVRLDDMLYASVRTNPKLGGKMRSYNAAEAKKMPGVVKVVDLGDGVGVIADNTWRAFNAVNAIEVEWGGAPYPATQAGMWEALEKGFSLDPLNTLRDDGDVVKASADAPDGITAEYRAPFLAHSCMEPMNATALVNGDSAEIWTGTQAPGIVEQFAAEALGLDTEQVKVHTTFLGGGFGRRGEYDAAVHAAKLANAVKGKPVKMTWTREEDMTHDFYRPIALGRFNAYFDSSKNLKGFDAKVSSPSPTYDAMGRLGFPVGGPDPQLTEGIHNQPIDIENYRVYGYNAKVGVPVGFWRSVGNSFGGFFHESFLDEIAHHRGVDPVEMRLQLMANHSVAKAVVEKVAEMSNWGSKINAGSGMGFAHTLSFGTYVAQVVKVSQIDGEIKIDKVWCVADPGKVIDPQNFEAQMMSGIIYGLTSAIMGEITFEDGEAEQFNFPDYDAMRMVQCPEMEFATLSNKARLGGAGEPGTPPSIPALANAIFDLTGERYRELPLNKHIDFV